MKKKHLLFLAAVLTACAMTLTFTVAEVTTMTTEGAIVFRFV